MTPARVNQGGDARASPRLTVVVCAEVFSSNLGDGVIAESLVHLLCTERPDVHVRLMDVSGRSGWAPAEGGAGAKSAMLRTTRARVLSSPRLAKTAFLARWYMTSRR